MMRVAGFGQLHLFKGRRQRGERPRAAPEFKVCCVLADTLRACASPDWWWMHYPAGEERPAEMREGADGEPHRYSAAGARLKRMGLRPGVADYLLISPAGKLHALEMKRGAAELTEAQEQFRDWCRAHNVPFRVARSYDQAVEILTAWGVLRNRVRPQ